MWDTYARCTYLVTPNGPLTITKTKELNPHDTRMDQHFRMLGAGIDASQNRASRERNKKWSKFVFIGVYGARTLRRMNK